MDEAEKILRVEQDIPWLPKPNESYVVLSSHLPPHELVTTAFALAFTDDCLLLNAVLFDLNNSRRAIRIQWPICQGRP
ncbi:MAG: hypothetical protein ACJ8BW_33650 [Ktedonobacteraceae bacterium]